SKATPGSTDGTGVLLRVRTGQYDRNTTRVVLDLEHQVPFSVASDGRTVTIELEPGPRDPFTHSQDDAKPAETTAAAPPAPPRTPRRPATPSPPPPPAPAVRPAVPCPAAAGAPLTHRRPASMDGARGAHFARGDRCRTRRSGPRSRGRRRHHREGSGA